MVRKRRKMTADELNVQVSFEIKKHPEQTISKKVLNELLQMVIEGKRLPKNVKLRGIFWRNPNRRGSLSDWRYHSGADRTAAPHPLESSPRGSLQDAIDTLSPFLTNASFNF